MGARSKHTQSTQTSFLLLHLLTSQTGFLKIPSERSSNTSDDLWLGRLQHRDFSVKSELKPCGSPDTWTMCLIPRDRNVRCSGPSGRIISAFVSALMMFCRREAAAPPTLTCFCCHREPRCRLLQYSQPQKWPQHPQGLVEMRFAGGMIGSEAGQEMDLYEITAAISDRTARGGGRQAGRQTDSSLNKGVWLQSDRK